MLGVKLRYLEFLLWLKVHHKNIPGISDRYKVLADLIANDRR